MEDGSQRSSVIQAENIVINNGKFSQINYINETECNFEEEMQALCQFVSYDAFYNSIKHPYPDHLVMTPAEQDIIDSATNWALETNLDRGQRILHLDLSACATEQYVAQHIAELFEQRSWLHGTFFFRFVQHAGNEDTHDPQHLFVSTLAYQLGFISLPDTKPAILGVICSDPSILTRNTRKQMQHLIIEPLQRVGAPDTPNVFVIAVGPELEDQHMLHAALAHTINALVDSKFGDSHIRFLVLKHSHTYFGFMNRSMLLSECGSYAKWSITSKLGTFTLCVYSIVLHQRNVGMIYSYGPVLETPFL
ncbi:hypothetical protein D9619_008729 [Psilocybe cf. subviscida]|uniref:Uncharacterized protein n=1 Tax=Psilocybe cf. subviscida TaxID=2480587 RepID=A0A8H5BBM4_9AGAR|nr:hypothetical protein D9619_008729 [Psilocybe cf. subviscida]